MTERATHLNPEPSIIHRLVSAQRAFFATGITHQYDFRIEKLHQLEQVLKNHEQDIFAALKQDLGKAPFEAYGTELYLLYQELKATKKNLKKCLSKHNMFVTKGLQNGDQNHYYFEVLGVPGPMWPQVVPWTPHFRDVGSHLTQYWSTIIPKVSQSSYCD